MAEEPKESQTLQELIAESHRLQEQALELLKRAAEIDRQVEARKRAQKTPDERARN